MAFHSFHQYEFADGELSFVLGLQCKNIQRIFRVLYRYESSDDQLRSLTISALTDKWHNSGTRYDLTPQGSLYCDLRDHCTLTYN